MSIHHAPATDRHDPYGDEADWDLDDSWAEEAPQSRVLWGRIAVFAATLLLAFVAGRMTANGNEAALQQAEAEVTELRADLEQARAELDAAQAGGTGAEAEDQPADAEPAVDGDAEAPADAEADASGADEAQAPEAAEAAEAAPAPAEPTSTTYTVQPGDYLFGLAEKFYGDGRQWSTIAEANNLAPGAVISPGQTLEIPAE